MKEREVVLPGTTSSEPPSPPRAARFHRLFPVLLHLLVLASLVYLFLLPHHPLIAQHLYIDENAWLTDSAHDRLTPSHTQRAVTLHHRLARSPPSDRLSLLASEWLSLGLDVHHWPYRHAAGSRWEGEVSAVMYGVVEARKGDGKESVAIVVELDSSVVAPSLSAVSGVAVVTGLAAYLTSVPWLARDVMIVAVEHAGDRARAVDALAGWLQHYRAPLSLNASYTPRPFRRCGAILAALSLDLPLMPAAAPAFSSFTVHAGGRYGLSPNLDIVSVTLRVMRDRGVDVGVAGGSGRERPPALWWMGGFDVEYRGLVRSAVQHVTGEATGYHGHFIHHNIDAVTIAALPSPPRSSRDDATGRLLLSLDAFLHASNNLIEKLHHSTWLYLLLSPTHFVTMSKYIYAFVLLMAPTPLLAMYELHAAPDHDWIGAGSTAAGLYALCVTPVLVMRAMAPTAYLGMGLALPGVSAVVGVGGAAVWMRWRGVGVEWRTLHALVLLVSFLVLSPLAILNFPLAMLMTALITPMTLWASRAPTGWLGLLRRAYGALWLVSLSPVSVGWAYARYWGVQGWRGAGDAVADAVYGDHLLYWLLPSVYLPLYIVSWALVLSPTIRPGEPPAVAVDKKVQ